MTSLLLGIIAALLPVSAIAQQNGLEFNFKTEKKEYSVGEPVMITFVWKNVGRTPLRIKEWRGVASAMPGFQVYGPDGKPARFVGFIHDFASRLFRELKPGEIFQATYTITGAQFGPYELTTPGKYRLVSVYSELKYEEQTKKYGEHWAGSISAPDIEILIRAGTRQELLANRALARTGDKTAIQYLALNRDAKGIPDLEAAYSGSDYNRRSMIATGLARIGTDAAVAALGRLAKTVSGLERTVLLSALGESKNKTAVPVLRSYLEIEDSYTGEMEQDGKKFKTLITRRVAANALHEFKIKVPQSVYEIPIEAQKK